MCPSIMEADVLLDRTRCTNFPIEDPVVEPKSQDTEYQGKFSHIFLPLLDTHMFWTVRDNFLFVFGMLVSDLWPSAAFWMAKIAT